MVCVQNNAKSPLGNVRCYANAWANFSGRVD
jgi:hypothetical protein